MKKSQMSSSGKPSVSPKPSKITHLRTETSQSNEKMIQEALKSSIQRSDTSSLVENFQSKMLVAPKEFHFSNADLSLSTSMPNPNQSRNVGGNIQDIHSTHGINLRNHQKKEPTSTNSSVIIKAPETSFNNLLQRAQEQINSPIDQILNKAHHMSKE